MKKNKYGTISLSMPLIEEVKKNIKGSRIHSVSAYVTLILRQIFSSPHRKVLDKKTEEEIKERLRNLGYL